MSSDSIEFIFYRYQPSMAAAVIFIVIFATVSIFHIVLVAQRKTYYFIPFVIGCLFETVGYIGRGMSAHETYPNFTTNPYVIQSMLLLLGPTLYAASIYMILGRLVVLLEAENYAIIKPRWLTKFFVLGDVLSFFIQGGGGAVLSKAKTESDVQHGNDIIIGGLCVQIIFFGFFVIVSFVFHRRILRVPTRESMITTAPWKQLLYVLYLSSVFIMIRSIYRVAEYITGSDGALQSSEAYLYCLDALPMFLVAVAYCWFHPSRVVNKNGHARGVSITSMEEVVQCN
ncbi:RTA1 like protein-domain-containing protein [Xylariales sp. PMI_506]|nr:RTA1 like protein-domain-containing protein [Xylariales sp. PMI_506]